MDKRLKEAPCGFISFDHNGYITEANKTLILKIKLVNHVLI